MDISPQAAGKLFMTGLSGKTLTPDEQSFIEENGIGFIILFSRNISNPKQVLELIDHIQNVNKVDPPMVFIDQEGGPVVRFGESLATVVSHMALAATGDKKSALTAGKIIGEELSLIGIEGVFAPVLDVNTVKENPVIGIRSFSDKKEIVADYGINFVEGIHEAGVIACAKHYPGHGATFSDSHLTLPKTGISLDDLRETNLFPFKKAINYGVNAIMSAHVLFSELDKVPATFSPLINRNILREELGFNGVLFSDCLEMAAISENYKPNEIVELSVSGGIDVMSVSHSIEKAKEMISYLKKKYKSEKIFRKRIDASLNRISKLREKRRRNRTANPVVTRPNIEQERSIAKRSVTLIDDPGSFLPLNRQDEISFLILKKEKRTTDDSVTRERYVHLELIKNYFPNSDIQVVSINENFRRVSKAEMKKESALVLIDNSHGGEDLEKYSDLIGNISLERKKIIFIAAESPYVLRKIRGGVTKIATFGSRSVQIEAMLEILRGIVKATGKLPVNL